MPALPTGTGDLSRRHGREKNRRWLVGTRPRRSPSGPVPEAGPAASALDPHHVGRQGQLGLVHELPPGGGPLWAESLRPREPLPLRGFDARGRRRGRPAFQKGRRPRGREVPTDLERARIVLLQRGGQLIEQPGLQVDLMPVVAGQPLQFLGCLRTGPQGPQLLMITPQKQRQHACVERITLARPDAKPIARAIQTLGVDRVHHSP